MQAGQDDAAALLDGLDLDGLLQALSGGRGHEIALRDPPGYRDWAGAAATSLSFQQLDGRIDALAGLLHTNRAQPGSSVAILSPLGRDALIATLASLRAGLSPLLLPLHAGEAELLDLIERSGAVMAIGSARIGPIRPLEMLRALAVRSFGMRFVGGFGSEVPDGVAPLDALMASGAPHALPRDGARAPLQLCDVDSVAGPVAIGERALLAAALDLSRLLKPLDSTRIVTTLIGGDLASLASGPAMALLAGVELLPLGLFSLGDLQACLESGRKTHLVLPAAAEPAMAHSRLAGHAAIESLVFVRRAGEPSLPAIDRPDIAIVDVVARSAAAVAATRRD